MKCIKCDGDMTSGIIIDHGHYDYGEKSIWAEKVTAGILGGDAVGGKYIEAYRCTKCGYVEIYANTAVDTPTESYFLGMPQCPKCKTQYSESTTTCKKCNIALIRQGKEE